MPTYDLLIRNGLVFDGTGQTAGWPGDVAIRAGRIVALGERLAGVAEKTIEAEGFTVAPGFIDVKTHSDFTLPLNPQAHSKVRQGVTTEIVGHCGYSVAPVLPGTVALISDYLGASAPWLPFRETTFADYLESFPPTAVNVGMLVGHNTLRLMVMGLESRAASASELAHMVELLEEALQAGALGMSSGLFTSPGCHARHSEILALCQVLARHRAGYFTHLRDESNKVIEAVQEAIDVAQACGIHVQIVHLKCSGADNWGQAAKILEMLAAARARGIDVDCDAYPYTAGSNPLKNLLPPWVQAGGLDAMLTRLRASEARAQIRGEIARDGLNNWGRIASWDSVRISISPHLPQHAGRTIDELARAAGQDPIDTLCDYLLADRGATRVLVTSISEDDVRELLRSPAVMVGSDGNCVATEGIVSQGLPHPRFYGTFPRVLGHYVRDMRLLPIERAIYKMTGGPARALRLKDRGLLKPGYRGDVTLFNPAEFTDQATYADPHRYPSGADTTVIVNGAIVVENATHTNALPGIVLRRDAHGDVR
jgi:N-acyl-D-amino-acid deacylase